MIIGYVIINILHMKREIVESVRNVLEITKRGEFSYTTAWCCCLSIHFIYPSSLQWP